MSTINLKDDNKYVLKFIKIKKNAKFPSKGSPGAAGIDLVSVENIEIEAKGKALVGIGIKIQLPEGTYGRIAPRSGLAINNFIDVGAGVIDGDFRDEIKVVLFNHGSESFKIREGDKIAQLICEKICIPEIIEVSELNETVRGARGFGSSGIKF